MERRSEIVEGLETLREAILGYDAAADPKGTAWDELRIELDRSVLALIEKAGRMTMVEMVPVREGANPHEQVIASIDLTVEGGDVTAVQSPSLTIKLEELSDFRRALPATWYLAGPKVIERRRDVDLGAALDGAGFRVWGVSERGRDFIAAKLRVQERMTATMERARAAMPGAVHDPGVILDPRS